MKKRTCDECGKELSRSACIRKDERLLHGGRCGGIVTEELIPDFVGKLKRRKIKNGKS